MGWLANSIANKWVSKGVMDAIKVKCPPLFEVILKMDEVGL